MPAKQSSTGIMPESGDMSTIYDTSGENGFREQFGLASRRVANVLGNARSNDSTRSMSVLSSPRYASITADTTSDGVQETGVGV
jgi:hypothetical protein